MDTFYTRAIHAFHEHRGVVNGMSSGIAATWDKDGVLSLIVVLGGSLSLVALVFAFITYSLFSDLRSLAGTTLMNLLASLFMVQLLFIIGVGGVQDSELCIGLGLSLQYLRISVVCWIVAMCHHLHATIASVRGCDDQPTYLKYSIFAWGTPLLTLGASILVQTYETNDFWNVTDLTPFNCWFLGTKATIYTYSLPIILLILISGYYLFNAAIIARYTYSMQLEIKQREKMKKRQTLQLILFLKICLTVGFIAGCGVAARVWRIPLLWAIFCTGHSLQGLIVALSVACNCKVLKVYARKRTQSKQQIAKSSSMQLLAPHPDPV
ncbi:cadherin EGF LAG seven-pass G-type receptor 1-like isoform X1 [Microplitis mediator]|uniref:cadherin EGF LAG seven-pass G-type receptor 1-like isoform X1 n=1 Tax=Microplitis mediator TaxID=375433 RepID=UPI002553CD94|nr:cadherin EGF LAG seven-pass G-type receptor 1-like isoform X1 [Microplitis mediator]XP_057330727.1 cadherin EGF LAG seven-pass G-type receptor 1-like isoform X1 [Microplitis mediator]